MRLNKLSSQDKCTFDRYLSFKEHSLSFYNFANIYIWRRFFDIKWAVIENNLCVFFKDNIGTFLYLSLLGRQNSPLAAIEVFNILDKQNSNPEFAHIENVEEADVPFYEGLGFETTLKSYDYLCRRLNLAGLAGDKFKSKRASCNYFTKHFDYKVRELGPGDFDNCLKLHGLWMRQRALGKQDHIYRGMLEDSWISLKEAFGNYKNLAYSGLAVEINSEIKGFTFGFKLNAQTFCILFEITDLSIKGLAQFIFRAFCESLKSYKYINIMDDSGLENLKKVKLSYHPDRLIPAYTVRRKKAKDGAKYK